MYKHRQIFNDISANSPITYYSWNIQLHVKNLLTLFAIIYCFCEKNTLVQSCVKCIWLLRKSQEKSTKKGYSLTLTIHVTFNISLNLTCPLNVYNIREIHSQLIKALNDSTKGKEEGNCN